MGQVRRLRGINPGSDRRGRQLKGNCQIPDMLDCIEARCVTSGRKGRKQRKCKKDKETKGKEKQSDKREEEQRNKDKERQTHQKQKKQ
jgi:hypothetical protein